MPAAAGREAEIVDRGLLSGSYGLLLLAIIVFAVATAFGLFKLREESDLARYESQAALWLVVSFEREYLKFNSQLLRYASDDPTIDADNLLTQFDVLWSRVTLMQEGEHSRPLMQVDTYDDAVPVMLELLRRHETAVFESVEAGRTLPPVFVEEYRAMAVPVHSFMVDVHLDRQWADEARENMLRDRRIAIYISLAGTLVSVLLLFVFILMQLRERHGNLERTRDALVQSEHDRSALSLEIARRKQVEDERLQLLADLADRNDELERYAYTISHDLKSPLYTIQGFAGFLEKNLAAGQTAQALEDLEKIRQGAQTMSRLLDDILNLSRAGLAQEPMVSVALDEVVERAISLVAREIDEHRVKINVASDLPVVQAEPQRLTEVFQNLLANAAKFMGDQPRPVIDIGAEVQGDRVRCFVTDNGIGIEPGDQARVFQLFERLETNTTGTGVGLSIVKQIVERHGGRIEVRSEGAGQGATFEFTLPLAKSADNSIDQD